MARHEAAGSRSNTLQHIHCRSPDTNITKHHNSNICRWHNHSIDTPNPHIAQQQVQPYLQEIYDWTTQNQLTLNTSKNHDHTFHTRPGRIQHNTYTTNQQHHTTHKQRVKNPRTHTRPETNLLKTQHKNKKLSKQFTSWKQHSQQHNGGSPKKHSS